jgi:cytochrome c
MHKLISRACIPVLVAVCLGQAATARAGDIKRGADVFATECSECHSARPGKNKKGPSVHDVVGRKAGELPDFKYSDSMRNSGWRWDEEVLRRYLTEPRRALPGGTMKYDGLSDAKALEDLLAYLASLK